MFLASSNTEIPSISTTSTSPPTLPLDKEVTGVGDGSTSGESKETTTTTTNVRNEEKKERLSKILKIEGGFMKRGGVKFVNGLPINTDAIKDMKELDEYQLNYDKVNITFGKELTHVPDFILRLFVHLRKRKSGLKEEGLFRKPGNNALIQDLKQKMMNGEKVDLRQIDDIHTLASLVKLYFRELPTPILTFECYNLFIAVDTIPEEVVYLCDKETGDQILSNAKIECLKRILSFLPEMNKKALKELFFFLNEVTDYSQYNLMNSNNLAAIFAPTLLRDYPENKKNAKEAFEEIRRAQNAIQLMIMHAEYLFDGEAKKKLIKGENFAQQITGNTVDEVQKKLHTLSCRLSTSLSSNIQNQISSQIPENDSTTSTTPKSSSIPHENNQPLLQSKLRQSSKTIVKSNDNTPLERMAKNQTVCVSTKIASPTENRKIHSQTITNYFNLSSPYLQQQNNRPISTQSVDSSTTDDEDWEY